MESTISFEVEPDKPMPLAMRFLEEIKQVKASNYSDDPTYFGQTGGYIPDYGSD